MTTDELVADTLEREGGFVDDPSDLGGATNRGITAAAWGTYLGLGRLATVDEVKAITRSQAEAFYRSLIASSPFESIPFEPLRVQLFDFGVNSGPARATRWLQRVLGIPVTGVVDQATRAEVDASPGPLLNDALVAARVRMYRDTIAVDATQAKYFEGWVNRALQFLIVAPAPGPTTIVGDTKKA